MRNIVLAGILLVTSTIASPIAAAPVHYDESVSGDLPGVGSPLPTFTLDVGANTVTGTTADLNFDSFAFIIPAGTQMLSVQVQLTDNVGNIDDAEWQLRSGSANSLTGTLIEDFTLLSPGSTTLLTGPFLGPGTYNVTQFGLSGSPSGASADYVFTLTLRSTATAAPEPGTLAFLALGVAGLTVARRRRHNA